MKLAQIFPDRPPEILDIASRLRSLVLEIFPDAVESHDEENLGFGFGEGSKLLVFVISPQSGSEGPNGQCTARCSSSHTKGRLAARCRQAATSQLMVRSLERSSGI